MKKGNYHHIWKGEFFRRERGLIEKQKLGALITRKIGTSQILIGAFIGRVGDLPDVVMDTYMNVNGHLLAMKGQLSYVKGLLAGIWDCGGEGNVSSWSAASYCIC